MIQKYVDLCCKSCLSRTAAAGRLCWSAALGLGLKTPEREPRKAEDKLRNQANNNEKKNKSWALLIFLPIFDSKLRSLDAFVCYTWLCVTTQLKGL